MEHATFTKNQESHSRFVAGGGWHMKEDLGRRQKSTYCLGLATVWGSAVYLIYTLSLTPAEQSSFLSLPLGIWLLLIPMPILLGFAFHFWRKEKVLLENPLSKPIPPYNPRNFY